MDSKLRRMTILASMAVILLAAMLVLYVNRERGERPARRMGTTFIVPILRIFLYFSYISV